MIETEYRLEEFARATLDVNGSGNQINVGPRRPGERWEIETFGASGDSIARLQIMRGNSLDTSRQLDITDTANSDTSPVKLVLRSSESISFWWTRGTLGAMMTCSIQGSYFVPGRRAY
jgi:hypothetical protein